MNETSESNLGFDSHGGNRSATLAFFGDLRPAVAACTFPLVNPIQSNPTERTLARLGVERQRLGITLVAIAEEASRSSPWYRRRKRTIGIATVSQVLRGRGKSANIIASLERLIAQRKAQRANGKVRGL